MISQQPFRKLKSNTMYFEGFWRRGSLELRAHRFAHPLLDRTDFRLPSWSNTTPVQGIWEQVGPRDSHLPSHVTGTHLTAQAPHASLADNAEKLGVVGVLVTDILNRGLFIVADIPGVPCSK